ncbi:hypothetical protein BJ165DRAFT_1464491 [Panaeolus papilionaceus]|nr:hypothetical protein BJ165DRAFT_1464491 [Panaeolus papilionaceus]
MARGPERVAVAVASVVTHTISLIMSPCTSIILSLTLAPTFEITSPTAAATSLRISPDMVSTAAVLISSTKFMTVGSPVGCVKSG